MTYDVLSGTSSNQPLPDSIPDVLVVPVMVEDSTTEGVNRVFVLCFVVVHALHYN